ncbi:MAG: Gfo/Idh/MocA family oxidoreductase [Saprospiraceae bacterium]|nr:Gfo/Idh/MocA family oxidoreductase [Candidatus Defluviibacterium haderslevense]MCI1267667.1 Gfo/Idh/MocA family oxidoreductase [Saprospiraceae bacterium]
MNKIKLGLVGLGHLGKIHLKCILQIPEIILVGCFDVNQESAQSICKEFGVVHYESIDQLIQDAEAIDIVTPTTTHYDIASMAIRAGKHCFIEKPVTQTLQEALDLQNLLSIYPVKVQIGHVERYNPSFLAIKPFIKYPKFIEAHRLSTFNPRGTDVSVVHDLMIHDLDIISLMAQSPAREIRASGVSIVSQKADICNARIEFESGLVCNVTASRISMKAMRKIRIFQEDAYISMDLLSKEAEVISLLDEYQENTLELDTYKGKKYIQLFQAEITPVNAILEEIKSFAKSIVIDSETEVNLQDGIRALSLVDAILSQIESSNV